MIVIVSVLVLLMSSCCHGQLSSSLDCTNNAALKVNQTRLIAASQGTLNDNKFLLFSDSGTLLYPDVPIVFPLNGKKSFRLVRQGDTFQGYLTRVSQTSGSFTFYIDDGQGPGKVAFCSALNALDSSSLSYSLSSSITSASIDLSFSGDSPYWVDFDVLAVITSGANSGYKFAYDRFSISVTSGTPQPAPRPTSKPSTKSPVNSPVKPPTRAPVRINATKVPTKAPVALPTKAPVFAPTRAPVSSPTAPSPTARPARLPTKQPFGSPTKAPVTQPTPAPRGSLNKTTAKPTPRPTFSGTVTKTLKGLHLTLSGVSSLDWSGQDAFVAVTENFYTDVYGNNMGTTRRFLQVNGVSNFATTIVFGSQNLTAQANANDIVYDQTISYNDNGQNLDPYQVVSWPFNNDTMREEYYRRLRASNPSFVNIPSAFKGSPGGSFSRVEGGTTSTASDGKGNLVLIAAVASVAGLVAVALFAIYIRRRNSFMSEHKPLEKDGKEKDDQVTHAMYLPPQDIPSAELVAIADDEVSALYTPSIASYDADQSMSTVDYDYAKVKTGGGNRSIVSFAGGTLGGDTRQDSLTIIGTVAGEQPINGRWAKLGERYTDENNIYVVAAPAGKLGVVVDTPDEGPPIIHAVKDNSVLQGEINVGDRLLAVDEEDVTSMSAVNISRLISKKSDAPVRNFTLMRTTKKSR